jgi:Haem-NO-binding
VYGLINEGLRDMVVGMAGQDAWKSMTEDMGIDPSGFEPLCPYDDSLTYKLVELVSTRFNLSQDEVLRRYGNYWITFTAAQGYGEMMQLFGSDFRSCLKNLNRMHGHMGAMMPNLSPPRFRVEERTPHDLLVHYYSPCRSGPDGHGTP